ncbi:MAG: cysteine methyltransferase, partial [Candidatus Neomarinimicrobiota bacterium]
MLNNDKILFRDIQSPLGPMIAGSTGKGVCFLEWHDRGGVDRIKERVEKRYRAPLIQGSDKYLNMLEKELTQYFKG